MAEIRRRIRKRGEKAEDYSKPVVQEEQKQQPIIKQEPKESYLEPQQEEPKPKIIKPSPEPDPDHFMTREQLKQAQRKYQIRRTINEINADITDDKRSQLVESNYWDETHSWGSDSEVESDDYWHFVGRYE